MQKLMSELKRLYLLDGQEYYDQGGEAAPAWVLSPPILERHLRGEKTIALKLVTHDGLTRALVMHFDGALDGKGAQQWSTLCEVANALQGELGLPAPAVSISGQKGYCLWLSFETPVPAAQARRFLHLLGQAHGAAESAALASAELPPCLHRASGNWAAFINPGMGSSFADEPGLEMAPPLAAQAAFLEGLHSIGVAQFTQALGMLEARHGAPGKPVAQAMSAPAGLLLKDATLEDIVRFLHAKNIEPTFRHVI